MGSENMFSKLCGNSIDTETAIREREKMNGSSDLVPTDAIVKPQIYITTGAKEAAVKAGLVPEAYIDCEFDIEKIKRNQIEQNRKSARKFIVKQFDKYAEITQGILSTIALRKLPKQSYILGAPNGFGKTSFVNSCIIKLFDQGKRCAPYISLTDLAQVKLHNEQRIMSGISSKDWYKGTGSIDASIEEYYDRLYQDFDSKLYVKKPINIIDQYSWSEYMSCDVLFVYFTDVSSKLLESEIFKTAITIRGAKGLPTIAMISTSLNPYIGDQYLAEYVWNEIMAYDDAADSCDRVKHISCWKDYRAPLK